MMPRLREHLTVFIIGVGASLAAAGIAAGLGW